MRPKQVRFSTDVVSLNLVPPQELSSESDRKRLKAKSAAKNKAAVALADTTLEQLVHRLGQLLHEGVWEIERTRNQIDQLYGQGLRTPYFV